jgi:hypothetical protein
MYSVPESESAQLVLCGAFHSRPLRPIADTVAVRAGKVAIVGVVAILAELSARPGKVREGSE